MLGRHTPQTSFADTDEWYKRMPPGSVWAQVRTWTAAPIHDDDYQAWYAETGRPSIPPSFVIPLLLLALRPGWSDREAVEAAFYDDRVKFALGLSRSPEIQIDRSTLCKYRGRVLATDTDRALWQQTLRGAADAGLLGADEDLVDSFMVAGAATRQGTLTVIRPAIAAVLRQGAAERLPAPALQRTDYAERRRPAIAWADAAARYALRQQLVGDSTVVPAWYTGDRVGSPSLQQAVALLATVTTQDTEADPAGVGVRIAERVADDRVISTVDPAMRHGRKTTATKVDGYKSHPLTQSVPPAAGARLITAVVAPVPPATNQAGRFPKGRFTRDLAAETLTCPQGVTVAYGALRPREDGVRVVRWAAGTCRACSLRAQCVGEPQPGQRPPGPRSVSVRPDEASLRTRRAEQATPAWQAQYRTRSHVEHVQAQQSRHGGRQGRYWGLRKNLGQARLVAAMYNLLELARVAALPRPPQPPRVTYA